MRPKSTAKDLPPRMLRKTKVLKSGKLWVGYYYNGRDDSGNRKEFPLGTDLNEAKRKWAEFENKPTPAEAGLMAMVFDRYERDILPTLAANTQTDYRSCLKYLRKGFASAPIDAITPQHVAQYRDARAANGAKVRANREKSLLSTVFNYAREWGYTKRENPCRGVRKNKETPRDYYAEDEVWNAVYGNACQELKDAMDLAYLTAQRPGDVLRNKLSDIKENALWVSPNKTRHSSGKKVRVMLEEDGVRTELGKLIDRIQARRAGEKVSSLYIVATPAGKALNKWTLRDRFEQARDDAARAADLFDAILAAKIRAFQFRDSRSKAASETDLDHASALLGHTKQEITEVVYRRVGQLVRPTK